MQASPSIEVELVVAEAWALKHLLLAGGDRSGQVQERDLQGYRNMLPDRWGAAKVEHLCARLDIEERKKRLSFAVAEKRSRRPEGTGRTP